MSALVIGGIVCGFALSCLGILVLAAFTAPRGWQDENGFHFGEKAVEVLEQDHDMTDICTTAAAATGKINSLSAASSEWVSK